MKGSRGNVVVVLGALVVSAATGGCGESTIELTPDPACAVPRAQASPSRVAPGDTVVVTATDMWNGCHIQGKTDPLAPLRDLSVVWDQEGQATQIATVSADATTGRARVSIVVPEAAAVGEAKIGIGDYLASAGVTVTAD